MRFLKILIVGGGKIGGQIAVRCAFYGKRKMVICETAEGLERSKKIVQDAFAFLFKIHKIVDVDEQRAITERITWVTDLAVAVADPEIELVIESVFELLTLKQQVHQIIRENLADSSKTIVASTTSSLLLKDIGVKVVGFHPFLPPHMNAGFELIWDDDTPQRTLINLWVFAQSIGLVPTKVKGNQPGFVGNGIFVPLAMLAVELLAKYDMATIEEACKRATTFLKMGMFKLANMVGLATAKNIAEIMSCEALGDTCKVPQVLIAQCDSGNDFDFSGEVNEAQVLEIVELLRGCILYHACRVVGDVEGSWWNLDRLMRTSFGWKIGPSEMMAKLGRDKVVDLVKAYCNRFETVPEVTIPEDFDKAFAPYDLQVMFDEETGTAQVTFCPKKVMFHSERVLQALKDAIADLESRGCRSVILTGVGPAFVVGADVKAMASMTPFEAMRYLDFGHEVFNLIERSKSMTWIMAVNGMAVGGGWENVLAGHYIISSSGARYWLAEGALNIKPGWGAYERILRRTGSLTVLQKYGSQPNRKFSAAEVHRDGLVHEVVEPEEVLFRAWEYAVDLAGLPPAAVNEGRMLELALVDLVYPMDKLTALVTATEAKLFPMANTKLCMTTFSEKGADALGELEFSGN